MRVFVLICSALMLLVSNQAFSQALEYANQDYRFSINFPAPPTQHPVTYTISDGRDVPATLFYTETRRGRFSVIALRLPDDAAHRSAEIESIADRMRARPGNLLYQELNENDGFPIQLLTLEAPDGRRSMIGILVHERRLFITEGNVASGAPPPLQFQQTLFMLDENGEKFGIDEEEFERLNPR
jgi:hypothetical protein